MNRMRRNLLLTVGGVALVGPGVADALPATPPPGGVPSAPGAMPHLELAQVYDARVDPALCLVSEKYDGVRACWDGTVLRHRSGRRVSVPAWFTARLPPLALDGELWLGRRRFDELSAVVRREHPDDARWREIRYMVFELPGAAGPFAERALAIARLATATAWTALQAAPQTRVADRPALRRRLEETVALGGEGLVLHRADAPWVSGRSEALLKLKPFLDAEATVIGHRRGAGKYAGETGALQVETPEGLRFFLGSGLPDALRRRPPAIGQVVTYRYHDRSGTGVPRFASFLRLHETL